MKKNTKDFMDKIIRQIGEAYKKDREHQLQMKACPKCQFEEFENGKCGHCNFTV